MVQSLKSQLMKRTHLEEQKRFVELYLYLSKDFRDLRDNPVLLSRLADICTTTINEFMPENVTPEKYHVLISKPRIKRVYNGEIIEVSGSTKLEDLIIKRLIKDSAAVDYAQQVGGKLTARDYFSNLAVTIGEAYAGHLERQLWPQIKQRHDSALQTKL